MNYFLYGHCIKIVDAFLISLMNVDLHVCHVSSQFYLKNVRRGVQNKKF